MNGEEFVKQLVSRIGQADYEKPVMMDNGFGEVEVSDVLIMKDAIWLEGRPKEDS